MDSDIERTAREIGKSVDAVCQTIEQEHAAKAGRSREDAQQLVMRSLAAYAFAQAEHLLKAALHATRMNMACNLIERSLKPDEIGLLIEELRKLPSKVHTASRPE